MKDAWNEVEGYGLTAAEAVKRLAAEGANELPTERERTLGAIAFEVVKQPMFLMLLGGGLIYLCLGDSREAMLLLGFVALVMGITLHQERRTERALGRLRDLSSPRALVLRDGQAVRIAGREVVRGDVVLLTGENPGSEPETQALCQLIHRIHPAWVVSFHDPLACIEDPRRSELGAWLAQSFELPLVTSVGYETPGSFGSWCADLNLHCITAEFPPISSDEASEKYLLAMSNLLRWHPRDEVVRS